MQIAGARRAGRVHRMRSSRCDATVSDANVSDRNLYRLICVAILEILALPEPRTETGVGTVTEFRTRCARSSMTPRETRVNGPCGRHRRTAGRVLQTRRDSSIARPRASQCPIMAAWCW